MEIMYQNTIYICISCIAKFVDSWWKNADVSRTQGCVAWFTYFLDLLWVRYNCAKFHYCRIYVTDFREGGPFCTPPPTPYPWAAPKKPILSRVKATCHINSGAERNFSGSNSYISRHIFRKFSNTSANNNIVLASIVLNI